MGFLAAVRFKLMFAWVYLLRVFLSYGAGNRVAAGSIKVLHPMLRRQKKAYVAGLINTSGDAATAVSAWQYHKRLVGVTRFQGSYYAREDTSWIHNCHLDIRGDEHIHAAQQAGRGVLVMTYHHHFNMLFCSLLGRLGLPITTIAMDDRGNHKYRKFGNRINRIYDHAEKLLNGGDIILVKPQSPVRPILRAFEKNHLVVTANDFPEVFDDKNRVDYPFLNTQLSCPTGTVKLAVKKSIPIVAAYLDWQGEDRFTLHIHPVSDGVEAMDVDRAMTRYLDVLRGMVEEQPGQWEGWKWLS